MHYTFIFFLHTLMFLLQHRNIDMIVHTCERYSTVQGFATSNFCGRQTKKQRIRFEITARENPRHEMSCHVMLCYVMSCYETKQKPHTDILILNGETRTIIFLCA